MKIKVFSDPGHAWAKVSFSLLYKLNIHFKISNYSYMRGAYAYLEEDRDLSILICALHSQDMPYSFEQNHTNKRSKIRNYLSYRLGA